MKLRPKPVYLGVKIDETETRGRDHPFALDIIAVNGACGRMGQRIVQLAHEDKELQVGAATDALLLERATTTPPAGAAHSSATEADTLLPPVTGLGDSASVLTRIGRTVTVSDWDTPP